MLGLLHWGVASRYELSEGRWERIQDALRRRMEHGVRPRLTTAADKKIQYLMLDPPSCERADQQAASGRTNELHRPGLFNSNDKRQREALFERCITNDSEARKPNNAGA